MIYYAWLTWLLPLLSVPLIPLVGKIDRRLQGYVAVLSTGLSFCLALVLATSFQSQTIEHLGPSFPYLGFALQVDVDGLSVLVSAFVTFVSFLVVVYSLGYMKDEPGQTRYYSMV
ncbi:MAG TPA: hypothetical protein VFE91_06955, partial [Nitrososphaerales archaeon]|nr:hypothetical protein [Nitrososphaerales archaeon]